MYDVDGSFISSNVILNKDEYLGDTDAIFANQVLGVYYRFSEDEELIREISLSFSRIRLTERTSRDVPPRFR